MKPGDKVIGAVPTWETTTDGWPRVATVDRVETDRKYGEPIVFFREGGWWRASQLRLVEPDHAAQTTGA